LYLNVPFKVAMNVVSFTAVASVVLAVTAVSHVERFVRLNVPPESAAFKSASSFAAIVLSSLIASLGVKPPSAAVTMS